MSRYLTEDRMPKTEKSHRLNILKIPLQIWNNIFIIATFCCCCCCCCPCQERIRTKGSALGFVAFVWWHTVRSFPFFIFMISSVTPTFPLCFTLRHCQFDFGQQRNEYFNQCQPKNWPLDQIFCIIELNFPLKSQQP